MEQNKVNSLDQKSAGSWCADPTKADRLSTQTLPNRLKSHCSCSVATSWQQSGGASLLASSPLWSFDRLKGQRGRRRGRKDGGGQLYFQMLPTCFASLAWMDANYFFPPPVAVTQAQIRLRPAHRCWWASGRVWLHCWKPRHGKFSKENVLQRDGWMGLRPDGWIDWWINE